jgi:AcrR family transcriptional regulator
VSAVGRPTLTTPETWAAAALDEIEAAGVHGLSVESVARRAGVSKGGLYHHFADRRALLRAALALWETRQVTELGEQFDAIADPRRRMHELLIYSGIDKQPTVIVQFMAAADDPDVAGVLARASEARLALLRRLFTQLGASRAVAAQRAILAYGHYLGVAQLQRQDPDLLATPSQMRAYLRQLETVLLAGL